MTVIRGEVISSEYDDPRHHDRPAADAHAWANLIRTTMGWAATCGQPGHTVDTRFRRANKWPAVDECVLRDRARAQLAESRTR